MNARRDGVPRMPQHLVSILDGTHLEQKPRIAFVLLTSDADGGARAALLSVGELLAPTPRSIAMALWPNSRTTANVARSGDATLLAADEHGVAHVRIHVERAGDIAPDVGGRLAAFVAVVVDVKEDVTGYAEVSSGILFTLPDPVPVLHRWTATVKALRRMVQRG